MESEKAFTLFLRCCSYGIGAEAARSSSSSASGPLPGLAAILCPRVGEFAPPLVGLRPELVLEELHELRAFALETARDSMARSRGFAMQSEIFMCEAHSIAGTFALTR